jgi:hypothetical protein
MSSVGHEPEPPSSRNVYVGQPVRGRRLSKQKSTERRMGFSSGGLGFRGIVCRSLHGQALEREGLREPAASRLDGP